MAEDDDFCASIVCCIVFLCLILMSIDPHVFMIVLLVICTALALCTVCVVLKHIVDDITEAYEAFIFRRWLENYERECRVDIPPHQPEIVEVIVVENPDTISVAKPSV